MRNTVDSSTNNNNSCVHQWIFHVLRYTNYGNLLLLYNSTKNITLKTKTKKVTFVIPLQKNYPLCKLTKQQHATKHFCLQQPFLTVTMMSSLDKESCYSVIRTGRKKSNMSIQLTTDLNFVFYITWQNMH